MQAEPYLIVHGTVIGTRRVDVPAREAANGTKADGTTYAVRATEAWSYLEVGINADAVYDGRPADELRSVLTVRLKVEDALPLVGEDVSYGVTASIAKSYIRGRFVDWVVYGRCLDLTSGVVDDAGHRRVAVPV